jgi:aminoglycoside phosphotransferase (APT) family kinase protein
MSSQPRVLTVKIAEELLGKFYPSPKVAEVAERTGGQLSSVYEVRCVEPAQRLIIKIYADQWRWKQAKELHVYRMLVHHGISAVPAILHSDSAGGPGDQAFTVMTLLDGQPLSHVSTDLDAAAIGHVYRQMGELLASVHRIGQDAFGYVVTSIVDPERTNYAYMTRQFRKKLQEFIGLNGDPGLHRAIEDRVADQANIFKSCPAPALCHNDFHEGNILVSRNQGGWTVSGFIDVENAIAADPILDLAKTECYSMRGDRTKRDAIFDGYGALPDDWRERLAIYQLYHALELWDWFASIGNSGPLPAIAQDMQRLVL